MNEFQDKVIQRHDGLFCWARVNAAGRVIDIGPAFNSQEEAEQSPKPSFNNLNDPWPDS